MRIVRLGLRSVPSGEAPAGDSQLPSPPPSDPDVPSITGSLGPGLGARLLMDLFVEERTGRLVVEDAPGLSGTLVFAQGEPVHVLDEDGAAIEARLSARGLLRPADFTTGLSELGAKRNPFSQLSRRSDPAHVMDALREEVRAFCRRLLVVQFGTWSFYDDDVVIDATPITALNPFGFLLDERRRALAPQALLRMAEETSALVAVPIGDFPAAAQRLRSFTSNIDLSEIIDGTKRVKDVLAHVGLDPLLGSLLMQSMVECGILYLTNSPRTTTPPFVVAPKLGPPATLKKKRPPSLMSSDVPSLGQLSAAGGRGVELLALYLEIKPERDHGAVLGLKGSSGPATIERCYQQRLAELDPRAIPAGHNRPYLLARVEELRAKVERAYRARTASHARNAPAYQVLDQIGAGGMAEVFRGRPTDDPDSLVAIKFILPHLRKSRHFTQMFIDEARLARRVQHPNVVRVLAVGKGQDDLYLAMEYVDGADLGDLVARAKEAGKPPCVELIIRIVAEACAGLHAAHTARDRAGIVTPILHRDVSPQNILVSRMGDVKLSDFGIAKALDAQDDEDPHVVKGKVPYLAPELIEGQHASVQSDIYAMVMTVYGSLARLPHSRGDNIATMAAIVRDKLQPLSSYGVPGVNGVLDEILLRAAARDPNERHATAQALQLELEQWLATRAPVDVAAWARPLCGRRNGSVVPRPLLSGDTVLPEPADSDVRTAAGRPSAISSDDFDDDATEKEIDIEF